MRNFLISGLVIGSLIACPVAFSTEAEHTAAQTEQASKATVHAKHHKAKHDKLHGKKHHRKHHAKKHHAKKHHGKKHHEKHKSSVEAPAEKKIQEETELNNR